MVEREYHMESGGIREYHKDSDGIQRDHIHTCIYSKGMSHGVWWYKGNTTWSLMV